VLVDCPPSIGLLTLNALVAASRLLIVTEPSFLALQGTDELLETRDLVRAHYNPRLELAGVIVNRVERTVEHRHGTVEIERYFGFGLVSEALLSKRTALQDATRQSVPVCRLAGRAAPELSVSCRRRLALAPAGRRPARRAARAGARRWAARRADARGRAAAPAAGYPPLGVPDRPEGLSNTLKHAGPAHASVRLRYGERALGLEVLDDGRGVAGNSGGGFGLLGMRERAALYGGVRAADARLGGGYALRARLPLERVGS